jgi:hypothetical protein
MRPCRSPFVMTARSGHGSVLPGVMMDGNVAVVLCLSGSRLAVRISGRAALSPEWSIPRVPSCIWLASPGCVAIGGRRALWPVCVSSGDRMWQARERISNPPCAIYVRWCLLCPRGQKGQGLAHTSVLFCLIRYDGDKPRARAPRRPRESFQRGPRRVLVATAPPPVSPSVSGPFVRSN